MGMGWITSTWMTIDREPTIHDRVYLVHYPMPLSFERVTPLFPNRFMSRLVMSNPELRIAEIEPITAAVGKRNQLLVKITTDDGLVGWGESGLSGRERAVCGALECITPFLIGQDARRIGRIWQEVYRSQYFEGGRVLTAAQSALDIALYDLVGKSLGVPVHQLLGGRQRDVVPSFASTSVECDVPESIEQVRALIALGWDCVRVMPAGHSSERLYDPRASLAATAEALVKTREAVGAAVALGIDYHHRLSVAEAASFCQRMPRGTLDFLEEPIRHETPEAYASLRTMTDVPFAIGEEFSSKWAAAPYIEQGLTQYLRLDLCNIGGFTEAMKVAGWCERHYIDLMPHNPLGPVCTAASVHLGAAVPNFSWLETRQAPTESLGFHDESIFVRQVRMRGSVYLVDDAPGLGVEIDESALRASPPVDYEPPHLVRTDGSVTNW